MTERWSQYRQIIIETFLDKPRGMRSSIRARAISGQFFPTDLFISCSTGMRNQHAVETKFRIHAKQSMSRDGVPFLYSHPLWPYQIVD